MNCIPSVPSEGVNQKWLKWYLGLSQGSHWWSSIHMSCLFLSKPYLTAWRKGHPCYVYLKKTTTLFIFVSVSGQGTKGRKCSLLDLCWPRCPVQIMQSSGMQDRSMKLWVRLEACLGYMLYAFHEGSVFTTTADIGFTSHLIWWNCKLLWKGWPQSTLLCHVVLLLPLSHINWLWSSRAG